MPHDLPIPALHLDGRRIGPREAAFVIAEIGVNHDGSVNRAIDLVKAARDAGADAIKLQLFSASRLVHRTAGLAGYQRAAGETDQAAMLRRFELSPAEVERVVRAARDVGVVPLATPFSPEDVGQIAALDLPAIKLASPDLVNPLLLDAAADSGRLVLASTGAADESEIAWAVDRLAARRASFALLHCVSSYPTPDAAAHLRRVSTLRDRYDCVVGLSDHTQSEASGALAVAAGASVIEKHLTYDTTAAGPDHAASADPASFARYVARIREAEILLGAGVGERVPQACEVDVRTQSRQSLVACVTIPAGAAIERSMLTCQRPGTGISAARLDDVLGRIATRAIGAGDLLSFDDIARREAA